MILAVIIYCRSVEKRKNSALLLTIAITAFIIARIIALLDSTYGLFHIHHFVFTLICYSKCSNLRLPETRSRLWKKKKTSPLFVPYNFDGNMLSSFMIKSFHHLSKGAFPQNLENFVSISKMIVQSFKIATILIIITC